MAKEACMCRRYLCEVDDANIVIVHGGKSVPICSSDCFRKYQEGLLAHAERKAREAGFDVVA